MALALVESCNNTIGLQGLSTGWQPDLIWFMVRLHPKWTLALFSKNKQVSYSLLNQNRTEQDRIYFDPIEYIGYWDKLSYKSFQESWPPKIWSTKSALKIDPKNWPPPNCWGLRVMFKNKDRLFQFSNAKREQQTLKFSSQNKLTLTTIWTSNDARTS